MVMGDILSVTLNGTFVTLNLVVRLEVTPQIRVFSVSSSVYGAVPWIV